MLNKSNLHITKLLSLSNDDATRSTKEDFPQRRGEIIMVFIPDVKFCCNRQYPPCDLQNQKSK